MGEADDLPDPIGLILYDSCMVLINMKMRNKRLRKTARAPKRENEGICKQHAIRNKINEV